MTRINCIDPSLLSDAHAGAEYRELPRIFGLVRAAIARGETPDDPRNPSQYTLGQGHCRFFYSRLGYLVSRYAEIVRDCKRRGRVVNYETPDTDGIGPEWFGDWEPDAEAVAMNVARIVERGGYDFRGGGKRMNSKDYWKECIAISAEECGLELTREQLDYLAEGAMGGHENYGMAFYSPPASDRINDIEREWKAKLKSLQDEFDAYRKNAETAVKKALRQYSDTQVSIEEHGEVLRHGGRTERIQ